MRPANLSNLKGDKANDTELLEGSAGCVWANQGINESMSNEGYFQVFLELSIPFRMWLIVRNCDH
jgi:hypothetical protein